MIYLGCNLQRDSGNKRNKYEILFGTAEKCWLNMGQVAVVIVTCQFNF